MRYSRTFDLFTDYSQFWLHDTGADVSVVADLWGSAAPGSMFAVGAGIVCVGTIRASDAPVAVEIAEAEPPLASDDAWDQIVECSLEIPIGRLVIHDDILGEDGSHETIAIPPGCYRVRVYYGSLAAQHTALEGDDHYLVVLWPGEATEPRVLKRWLRRDSDAPA